MGYEGAITHISTPQSVTNVTHSGNWLDPLSPTATDVVHTHSTLTSIPSHTPGGGHYTPRLSHPSPLLFSLMEYYTWPGVAVTRYRNSLLSHDSCHAIYRDLLNSVRAKCNLTVTCASVKVLGNPASLFTGSMHSDDISQSQRGAAALLVTLSHWVSEYRRCMARLSAM